MSALLFALRLVLAAVFVVAGVAKLRDRSGTSEALAAFGVPARLGPAAVVLLPLAELGVAAGLLWSATARWAAAAAVVLLAAFTVAIVTNLRRGRQPECHCFGALSTAPVGWRTVARNGVLLAGAGVLAVAGGGTAPSELPWSVDAAVLALGVASLILAVWVALLSWLLVHLMRQNGALSLRVRDLESASGGATAHSGGSRGTSSAGLPTGTTAPAFDLPSLSGGTVSLDGLLSRGSPVLLVFSDPSCGPCSDLLPHVARWQSELAGRLTPVVVTRGGVEANRSKMEAHGITDVVLQDDREVSTRYAAPATPMAVLVGTDGRVSGPTAAGVEAIRRLVESTVDPATETEPPVVEPRRPAVGAPAPGFVLPDVAGERVALADLAGRRLVVVFWDPGCGFCAQVLDDLREWSQARPAGAPELVLVSAGSAAEVVAERVGSVRLLDPDFAVGRAYGAPGTPTAVVVGADGTVESELAVGGAAVLELARSGAVGSLASSARAAAGPARAGS